MYFDKIFKKFIEFSKLISFDNINLLFLSKLFKFLIKNFPNVESNNRISDKLFKIIKCFKQHKLL